MMITLFNLYMDNTDTLQVNRTYFDISEQDWQDGTTSSISDKKLNTAKTTTIYLHVLSLTKEYKKPKEYLSLTNDEKQKYFTLRANDKIIRGKYTDKITSLKDFNKLDDLVNILTVQDNRFGSNYLQHFEIGGA